MQFKVKQSVYTILGFLAVGLGVLGSILPGLPATPFLLLALYCFSKGSKRFHAWFINTKLYNRYLSDFVETRTMALKSKITILIFASLLISVGIILTPILWVRIVCGLLIGFKYYIFLFRIKTQKTVKKPSVVYK